MSDTPEEKSLKIPLDNSTFKAVTRSMCDITDKNGGYAYFNSHYAMIDLNKYQIEVRQPSAVQCSRENNVLYFPPEVSDEI